MKISLSSFLKIFHASLFRFFHSSTNQKPRFFYTLLFACICLYYSCVRFIFVPYPGKCFFPSSPATDQASLHPLFLFWTRRIDENLTSDTAHHALTSSRLENAWRYFCARTASSTYFHISGLSLALPDILFLSPLMTRTMVVRVHEHACVSSE